MMQKGEGVIAETKFSRREDTGFSESVGSGDVVPHRLQDCWNNLTRGMVLQRCRERWRGGDKVHLS